MKLIYQSSLILAVCSFFVSCQEKKQVSLYFDRSTFDELVVLEKGVGAIVDTVAKDIPRAFKPGVLQSTKAELMLQTVRYDSELPIITRYYFDSGGQLIFTHYEWSFSVPGISYEEREIRMNQEVKQFGKYAEKLEQLAVQLQAEMGDPIENDGALKKNKTSLLDFFSHKMKFYKGGKTVGLCLIWSPKRGARFFKVFTKTYWEN